MKMMRLIVALFAVSVITSGCGAEQPVDRAAPLPSASLVPAAATTASPASGVTIRYEGNAQVELSANGGARVLIDVYDPSALSAPPTAGQLKALGKVDLAVTQFENSFSHMDAINQKGFRLMEQAKPRLIVQTHTSPAAVQYAATLWRVLVSARPSVTVTAADLHAETSLLLLGDDAAFYAGLVPTEKVDW